MYNVSGKMRKLLLLIGIILLLISLFFGVLDNPYKYLIQSKAYIRSGKVAKAIEILEKGKRNFPDDKNVALELVRAYCLAGEIQLADEKIIVLQKSFDKYKNNQDFRNLLVDLAEANYNAGEGKYARYFARQYLKYEDRNELSLKKARQLTRLGQILDDDSIDLWERAYNISHAAKALELKQGIKALLLPKYLKISEEFARMKKYDKVLEVLNKAEVLGKSAAVNFRKAKLYDYLGNLSEAQEYFDEAVQLEQDNNNYKIAYADFLRRAAQKTSDKRKQESLIEKAKLLLVGNDDPRNVTLLNKILNLHSKYKVVDSMFELQMIGEYLYPSLIFKILPVSDVELKKYKVTFVDGANSIVDEHEDVISNNELNQLLELTSKVPVSDGAAITARLYLNNELIKEYKK